MASDEIVWQVINQQFCSYKIKTTKNQTFCRNEYNVSGLCSRQACPLANSQYASVRADTATGALYLYTKTIERAHTPARWWERVRLPRDYASALATIDSRLQYWPFWQVHKCKQRLTRLTQVALRTRRLAKEQERLGETLVPRMAPKVRRREEGRERKALAAAKVERAIERELVERLRSGAYGDRPLNAEEGVWKKVLRALERSGKGERDEDLDEGIENEEEEEEEEQEREMEREWEIEPDVEVNGVGDVEYVSDVDESDEDDDLDKGQDIEDLGELEDWLGGQSEEDDVDDYDDEDDEGDEEAESGSDDDDERQSISSKLDFESEDDAQQGLGDGDDSEGNNYGDDSDSPENTTAAITKTRTITSPLKRKRSDIPPSPHKSVISKTKNDSAPESLSSSSLSPLTTKPPSAATFTTTTKNNNDGNNSIKTNKKSKPNRTAISSGNGTVSTAIATATATPKTTAPNTNTNTNTNRCKIDINQTQNGSTKRKGTTINKNGPARTIEYEYEYEYEDKGRARSKGRSKKDAGRLQTQTQTKMKTKMDGAW